MSVDNGIYVLVNHKEEEREYRVAHAGAIENLWWPEAKQDVTKDPDSQQAMRIFGKSPVFTDKKLALGFAFAMALNWEKTWLGECYEEECLNRLPKIAMGDLRRIVLQFPGLEYGIEFIHCKAPFPAK